MGANYSRLKTWVAEKLTFSDLNAEIDNILNNHTPPGMDDYSASVIEMQTQTDPGEVGTESQATSLAGEIERLRYQLAAITGNAFWYTIPPTTLTELTVVDNTEDNKIISAKTSSKSNQSTFIDPDGSTNEIVVTGASTALVYKIAGTQYTIDSDVTVSSLITAPGTQNTCLVDDTDLAGGNETKFVGENGTTLTVSNMGTNITTKIGTYAAFKIVGAGTEYMLAFVKSATELTNIHRGYFFDSTLNGIERTTISNNDTITLMNLTYLYATTTSAVTANYLAPIVDVETPVANLGQYWYDLTNSIWKIGNGSGFDVANALPIGLCIQDSANSVGARAYNFQVVQDDVQTIQLEYVNATSVKSTKPKVTTSVFGSRIIFSDHVIWDITADLDSGISEGSSTIYYLYLNELGNAIISDIAPYQEFDQYLGYYHPFETWRAIGSIENDGSSDFDSSTLFQHKQNNGNIIEDQSIDTLQLKDNAVTTAKTSITAPTSQTFTSGTGTYTTPANVKWIRVLVIGGGGGGGSTGTNVGTVGTAGAASSFGTSLLTANGGAFGVNSIDGAQGGAGGTASLGSGPIGLAVIGTAGSNAAGSFSFQFYSKGSDGGGGPIGGIGRGSAAISPYHGDAAPANSGSGGGSAAPPLIAGSLCASGGGAGGNVDAIIGNPLATYAYVVGAGGGGGTAGASGGNGGAGGSGLVYVEEHYI